MSGLQEWLDKQRETDEVGRRRQRIEQLEAENERLTLANESLTRRLNDSRNSNVAMMELIEQLRAELEKCLGAQQ